MIIEFFSVCLVNHVKNKNLMKKQVSVPFMIVGILFCVCLILSNFLETKLIMIGPFSATAGIIIFPIAYILNDCIAEVWGFKKARLIIWLGFAINFLAVAFTQIAVALPPAPYYEGEEAFRTVFGATPRITMASFIAFLAGSFVNAYVMSKMKVMTKGKGFGVRAVISTVFGESLDSLIFFPIAFWGIVPFNEMMMLIITQASFKTLYEIIILPVTKIVVNKGKKVEGVDVYDTDISYNVLNVKEI